MEKSFKDLRVEAGLTQQALAAALGVAVATVSRWEIGQGDPVATMFPNIAKKLKVTTEALREALRESQRQGAEQKLADLNRRQPAAAK